MLTSGVKERAGLRLSCRHSSQDGKEMGASLGGHPGGGVKSPGLQLQLCGATMAENDQIDSESMHRARQGLAPCTRGSLVLAGRDEGLPRETEIWEVGEPNAQWGSGVQETLLST